jgi:hypothetical protein
MINIDRKINEGVMPIFIFVIGIEDRNVGLSLDERKITRMYTHNYEDNCLHNIVGLCGIQMTNV